MQGRMNCKMKNGETDRIEKANNMGSPVLSLLALYARSSFGKILGALAVMAVAEGVSFYLACGKTGEDGVFFGPERMIDLCFLKYFFLGGLALAYFILVVTESERGGCKTRYTLLRLQLSIKRQYAVRAAYNFLCLALVFALQIVGAFVICRLYAAKLPAGLVSPQYLFLAFYRNDFLHCMLPMADVGKWICNFLLLLALSMDAACGSSIFREKREKRSSGSKTGRQLLISVWIFSILSRWFVSESNSPIAFFYALFSLAMIVAALLRLFGVIGGGSDAEA